MAKEKAAKAPAEEAKVDQDVKMASPEDAPPPPPPAPPVIPKVAFSADAQIQESEESKQRFSWLALRAVRDQHLALFSKIGTGDVELLIKGIEAPQKESGSASPVVRMDGEVKEKEKDRESVQKVEEDTKMEV